jgi:hypothetical protein
MENPEKLSGSKQGPFKNASEFDGDPYLIEVSSGKTSLIARESGVKRAAYALSIEDKDMVEVAKTAKKVFERLKNEYKIPVAVHAVLADSYMGQPVIKLLTDKIEGKALDADADHMGWLDYMSEVERTRFINELDNLLISLASYALENYKKNDFMWDIGSMRQYMWGKKAKEGGQPEDEAHLYLVDIDLYTNASQGGDNMINSYIRNLFGSIERYEEKLNVKFTKARDIVREIIKRGGIIDPATLATF